MRDYDNLRLFAHHLDLYLGVESRKFILEGNEKLTRQTDDNAWTTWMSSVGKRLRDMSDGRPNQELLLNDWAQLNSLKRKSADEF
jgi:hypothetical protein